MLTCQKALPQYEAHFLQPGSQLPILNELSQASVPTHYPQYSETTHLLHSLTPQHLCNLYDVICPIEN